MSDILDVLDAASDALGEAVERYDCMGWYDTSYVDADQLEEAQGVEKALARVRALEEALKRGPGKFWIFTQPWPDWEPYTGPIFGGATEGEARKLLLDDWLARGRIDQDQYDRYMDEAAREHLDVHGPFVLPAAAAGGDDLLRALSAINQHRARSGQPALDPARAGWGPDDVLKEARRLRAPNLKQRLLR